MTTIQQTCAHCREIFVIRRNPAQHYCHQKACQQVRKNLWRQNQRAQDEDYRENQCRANQHWRKKHPDYWRHYRQTHPGYQQHNRELQNQRDRKRRAKQAMTPNSVLANSDALQVEITIISDSYKNSACLQRDHLIANGVRVG